MEKDSSHLLISAAAYSELIKRCTEAYPYEACGIMAASGSCHIIDTLYPIANIDSNPIDGFAFDPEEWTSVYFQMQKKQQQLVGLYHSHPHSEAEPSTRDRSGFLPQTAASYWIVSLKNELSPIVQPYRNFDGKFVPIPLVLA